jgi:hypothetical protein
MSARERELVSFARQLVATPSLPGEERDAAELMAAKLVDLGYRDVTIDEASNVVGYLGTGPPVLMFNGHLDHVPPAGMEDPYGAQIVDGHLRGRGSLDMKANLAAGAFAAAFVDGPLRGSYVFTADVREEIDGPEGIPALLARGLRADYGVSGEATSLDIALGHRGKLQFDVSIAVVRATPPRPTTATTRSSARCPFWPHSSVRGRISLPILCSARRLSPSPRSLPPPRAALRSFRQAARFASTGVTSVVRRRSPAAPRSASSSSVWPPSTQHMRPSSSSTSIR